MREAPASRREQRAQRRATAQAREAADAAGPRTRGAPVEHCGAQREGRRAAEDHRGRDEAQRAGVGRAHRRRQRREGRRRQRPARRRRTRAARRHVDRAGPARHRSARRAATCSRATGLRIARGGRALFGDGIDCSIRGPERIALTGPNGAGKTTLLRDHLRRTPTGRGRHPAGRRADRLPVAAARPARPGPVCAGEPRRVRAEPERDAADASAGAVPVHGDSRFTCRSRRCPAARGCAPRLRACCTPNRRRSCCCSTSRPTTSISSASAQLESALNAYRGAFVVVSHDDRFLQRSDCDRFIRLAARRHAGADCPANLPLGKFSLQNDASNSAMRC